MFKKIGQKIIFSIVLLVTLVAPFAHIAHAQESFANETQLADNTALPECLNLTKGSVRGCIGQLLYWAGWWPTQWLAARAGGFLDFFLFYSISSNTYRGVQRTNSDGTTTNYIQEGWEVVRDISNILFVFALLYIGLSFVVGNTVGNGNPKKLLIYVIVMALIINFSLFASRVVVDAGNILARTIYNQVNLVGRGNSTTVLQSPDGVKSIGVMLISLANPQKLILDQTNSSTIVAGDFEEIYVMYFILMTLGSIIFNSFLIYLFLAMAFYFLGRIVSLYYSMIFSPFAFASLALPKGASLSFVGFNSWLKNLMGASFMAPLYLFFIYLAIKFLDIGIPINPNISGSNPTAQLFMGVAIPFAFVIAFLVVGKKVTQKMSGDISQTVADVTTKSFTATAGIGMIGASLFTRGAIKAGGFVAKKTNLDKTTRRLGQNGRLRFKAFGRELNLDKGVQTLARGALRTGKSLKNMKTDARDTQLFSLANQSMKAISQASGDKNVADFTKGPKLKYGTINETAEARRKKREEELNKGLESLQINGLEAKRHDEIATAHNKKLDPEKQQEYEKALAEAERNFRKTSYFKNLKNDLEKERELATWKDNFNKNYTSGTVEDAYEDSTGEAILRMDNASVEAHRLSLALANLRENTYYKKATGANKSRLERDLTRVFRTQYATGNVVENANVSRAGALTAGTTYSVDSIKNGNNNLVKSRRLEALMSDLKNSFWWSTNTNTAVRNAREALIERQFESEYRAGNVITEVDNTSGLSKRGASEMTDISDRKDKGGSYYDTKNYRRIETSTEINRKTQKLYATEQLLESRSPTSIYGNTDRRKATEEFARKNIKEADKDSKNQVQINQLTLQLEELNDTLGSYYAAAQKNPGFESMSINDFIYQAENNVTDQEKTKSYSLFNDQTQRKDVNSEFRKIVSYLDGQLGAIEASIKNIQDRASAAGRGLSAREVSDISRYNSGKAKIKRDRDKLENGLNQRTTLNERIANARKKDS